MTATTPTTVTVCGDPTPAPVAIRWIQSNNGTGRALHVCPQCVYLYDHGPQWDDDVPGTRP
ncbi:hypothetical protein [Streptomyces jumonjinensis]|uniref:hypothetical protein n=1 Tax=Streptomyces jumonjinensis TaxID=1945 RepID=UPI0037A910C4